MSKQPSLPSPINITKDLKANWNVCLILKGVILVTDSQCPKLNTA